MELLLLLTAFLASLTGGQADRAVRQVQGVAVVHAAEVARAAVQPARRAAPAAVLPALRLVRTTLPVTSVRAPAALRLPFERRLE